MTAMMEKLQWLRHPCRIVVREGMSSIRTEIATMAERRKVKEPSADSGRHNNQNKEYTMQDDTTIMIQNTIHNVEVEYLKVVESTIAKSLPQ